MALRKKPETCCKDLEYAMTTPPVSTFRLDADGVLNVSVGYARTDQGVGWFDQAVIFCPFCGKKIQEAADIGKRKA